MADNFAFMLQVLTQTGCQCHAVPLTALGITSLQTLSDRASEAASQGVDAEDIAARLMAPPAVVEPGRADLPVRRRYASASFDAAVRAAQPANRKRSLDDLDANLLASSSTRPMETRVKAWQRLCEEWEVKPWPISFDAIKKVCASLRQGGTPRWKGTSTPLSGTRRRSSASRWNPYSEGRRLAKAATRGLVVDTDHYIEAFDITNASHIVDVLIVACWFMMREIEMASAKTSDIEFQRHGLRSSRALSVPVFRRHQVCLRRGAVWT